MWFRTAMRVAAFIGAMIVSTPAARAQSLAPLAPSGQLAYPVFEGWYKNPDGTFSLSFGYFNRNSAEQLDIPIGDDNFVAPGVRNQGQPTRLYARRHYGVFAVVVPADFGTKKVVWTLRVRGQTMSVPGSLNPDWEIDAIQGEASADNTPPRLSFDGTNSGQGPRGIISAPMTARVGTPLALSVKVTDDAKAEPVARAASPVTLAWFLHQGPANVTFAPATQSLSATGGTGATSVTFSAPGDYLLRVRANDSAVSGAGHAQCCWTNAFVRVTVIP